MNCAPLVIALFFRATAHANDPTGVQFLRELYSGIIAFVLLRLSAVVFGTAAFGGEIDDGTIVYLLVKSLPRWQLVLSKYVVAVISTFVMMFVAILLPWLALGVLYIVVIEITLSPYIVGLKSLSVREFVMTVVGKIAAGVPGVKVGAVSTNTVWTMGAIILVASLALGIRWLQQYEMAERI